MKYGQWINVEDDLPHDGEHVVAYREGRISGTVLSWFTVAPFATATGHFKQGFAFADDDVDRGMDGRVTHWLRLPLLPDGRLPF